MSALTARALSPLGGLVAFLAGLIVVYLLGTPVMQMIMAPLCEALPSPDASGCTPVFVSPKEVFLLKLRQGILAGLICAMPAIVALLSRVLAPSLWRETPGALVPFALAGGVLALCGAGFAIFYEAPAVFVPALISLNEMSSGRATEFGLLAANYANAVVIMAGGFVLILQLPVLALMMIKSLRTRRALNAEEAR